MRLLLVEDDSQLNQRLYQSLTAQGYAVDTSFDGEEGLFLATETNYDVAVIDIGLPKLDGLALITQLREDKSYPVLLLTARDTWQDKVLGLNSGADDYLAKPFQEEELFARLKALIRRSAGQANPVLKFNQLTLDTNLSQVLVDDKLILLTAYEYKLLEYFARHPQKIISKTELTEHLYEQDFDRDSNVIEVFVKRLRKKLNPEQANLYIQTVRGQGYKFDHG